MNTYIYSLCEADDFPSLETIVAKSYSHAVEKLIKKFVDRFEDDDEITDISTFEVLQEYLNATYNIVISYLYDIDDFK